MLIGTVAFGAKGVPYKDKTLPVEVRVNDLLQRMTLEEKVGHQKSRPLHTVWARTNEYPIDK